jgi:hypothetical protein
LRAACEQQVSHVRAGDQQDRRDRGEEHVERRPHLAPEVLLQARDRELRLAGTVRPFALQRERDRVELGLSGAEIDAGA